MKSNARVDIPIVEDEGCERAFYVEALQTSKPGCVGVVAVRNGIEALDLFFC